MRQRIKAAAAPFAYLWQEEPKGIVQVFYDTTTRIVVRFANGAYPTIHELNLLRLLLPKLGAMYSADVKQKLGNNGKYCLGEYGRAEGSQLAQRARELGLLIEETETPLSYFVPLHPDGSTGPVIDDKVVARYVMRKMIDAGCAIVPVEMD